MHSKKNPRFNKR